ncbi:uncharacterized protein LOC144347778 [Saccoglossus kowalevskii]
MIILHVQILMNVKATHASMEPVMMRLMGLHVHVTLATLELYVVTKEKNVQSYPCYYGDCTDLVNAYQCTCWPGFESAEENCLREIDECESSPCVEGQGVCIDR